VDTYCVHTIMDVEWDEAKRRSNLRTRGVDFADAALIFLSPVIENEDDRTDYGESRYRALGKYGHDYFLVAYTWRGDVRRIISAWKVDDAGRKRYETKLRKGG
jgi:uncharacterized protein